MKPQTIPEILSEIRRERTLSRSQLYTYIRALGIEPLGAAQRPQRYPSDTAKRILSHLGFVPTKPERILSASQLKKERVA